LILLIENLELCYCSSYLDGKKFHVNQNQLIFRYKYKADLHSKKQEFIVPGKHTQTISLAQIDKHSVDITKRRLTTKYMKT